MWVSGAALLALTILVVSAAWLALRTRQRDVPRAFRRYLAGMVAPLIATLGVFLGVGFTAALDYGVLRILRPADPAQTMGLPLFHVRIAYAAGTAVAVAAFGAIVLVIVKRVMTRRFEPKVLASSAVPDGQVRAVAGAWWLARVKYHVQWPVLALAGIGVILTVAAVFEALEALVAAGGHAGAVTECRPSGVLPAWLDWLSDCQDRPGPDLVTIGTVALILLGVGLVYLGRSALGSSATRRSTCVVWDLVAFWPRAVHPLVPPPYSPKVIEDLRRRIVWHLGECSELAPESGGCTCRRSPNPMPFVVLAGHSQGSLISAAALTRLSKAYRPKVALLTFGSQLQIAYARGFPSYVNHPFLRWLSGSVVPQRWLSLFRETDPIGGPVLSWDRTDAEPFSSRRLGCSAVAEDRIDPATGVRECGPEWRLTDPVVADGQTSPCWGMRRHSSYSLDPAWDRALARLAGLPIS
jgi:hypothetical protein